MKSLNVVSFTAAKCSVASANMSTVMILSTAVTRFLSRLVLLVRLCEQQVSCSTNKKTHRMSVIAAMNTTELMPTTNFVVSGECVSTAQSPHHTQWLLPRSTRAAPLLRRYPWRVRCKNYMHRTSRRLIELLADAHQAKLRFDRIWSAPLICRAVRSTEMDVCIQVRHCPFAKIPAYKTALPVYSVDSKA